MTRRKIYKYPIPDSGRGNFSINYPFGGKIVHVGIDEKDGNPYIWVEFAEEEEKNHVSHNFCIIGTGRMFECSTDCIHIGTFQENPFVWHLYQQR